MKKLLLAVALSGLVASAFGQGVVQFRNYVAGSIDAPVHLGSLTGALLSGANPNYRAALLGGYASNGVPFEINFATGTATAGTLAMLFHPSVTTLSWVIFDSRTAAGQTAGYARVGAQPGRLGPDYSSVGLFQMVAWEGPYTTWQEAWAAATTGATAGTVRIGVSNPVQVTMPTGPLDTTPANLVGLQSFFIDFVPEPTTFALAGLGAAALLIFRRRS